VDSMGQDLIPFEDELQNIMNYVDLEEPPPREKIRGSFQREFSGFPRAFPLSFQPLVEKFHQILSGQRKRGWVISIISSSLDEKMNVVLSLEDNGVGLRDRVKSGKTLSRLKKSFGAFQFNCSALRWWTKSQMGHGTITHDRFPLESGQS